MWTSKTRKFPYFANHQKRAKVVRFGLKWSIDLSWPPTTDEEILAVYEVSVRKNRRFKTRLAVFLSIYKYSYILDVRL